MRCLWLALLLVICVAAASAPANTYTGDQLLQAIRAMFGGDLPDSNADLGLTDAQADALRNLLSVTGGALPLASGGFGDRLNSYAWSMAVYNGDVYVGTLRYPEIQGFIVDMFHLALPDAEPPTISALPDIPRLDEWYDLTAMTMTDPRKFAIWNGAGAAEIWRYRSATKTWHPVFKAQYVPSYLPGFYTAETRGFRKMDTFTDSTGRSAIFAFSGISTRTFTQADYMPLAYRSENGADWELVPTPAVMGKESRASTVFDGRLFVGGASGAGVGLWYTPVANPTAADWVTVDTSAIPAGNAATSLAGFDGRLYVGTGNIATGFEVWAGTQNGSAWTWERVMSNGGTDHANIAASTMRAYRQRLYVASMTLPVFSGMAGVKGFDLYRIRPRSAITDGSRPWDLVVGNGTPVLPVPEYEGLVPVSHWPSGFGNPLNFYGWSLQTWGDKLLVGTFDASSFLQYATDVAGLVPEDLQQFLALAPLLASGGDIWQTSTGNSWRPLALNGFGRKNNYGIRNMTLLGNSLIVGTSNPFDGCEVWQVSP